MIHFIGKFEPIWHTERYTADALEWWGKHVVCYDINSIFDRPNKNGNPPVRSGDVVLISQPHRFSAVSKRATGRPAHLDAWHAAGAKLVCWFYDWIRGYVDGKGESREDSYLPVLDKFDLVCSTDGYDSTWYTERGIKRQWLPQAAPQDARTFKCNVVPDCNVLFIGSVYTQSRKKLIDRLVPYGVCVANGRDSARIWGAEFTRLCVSTPIVIGDNFRNDIPGYWSDRVYRVLAHGGLLLTPHVPGLENHFEDGKHLLMYDSPEHAEELVKEWLTEKSKHDRARIATDGHRLAIAEHTYTERVGQLLEMVDKIDNTVVPVGVAPVEVKPPRTRIGLLSYTNRTSGLGNVGYDLFRNLPIDSVLSVQTLKGQARWHKQQLNGTHDRGLSRDTIIHYFEQYRPEVLLAVETFYHVELPAIAAKYKVKLALIPMHEVYRPDKVRADLWICPNQYCYDKVKEKDKVLWRLPVDANDFPFMLRFGTARNFLHNYGYGYVNNKRQIDKVIAGFQLLKRQDVTLTISTQMPLPGYGFPIHRDGRVRFRDDNRESVDAYRDADVMVQPEAYAGYGRATLEAMLCGIPVITTDAPPMNEVVTDPRLLIQPARSRPFKAQSPFNAVYNEVSEQGVYEALGRALEFNLQEMSKAARAAAMKHTWTKQKAKELTTMLEGLIEL